MTSSVPVVSEDRLGVIVGHSLPFDEYLHRGARREITVGEYPPVTLVDLDSFVVLPRHGIENFTPAHRLAHHAHIATLAEAGCGRVLAIASVGSLRKDWVVGTVAAPDDFIALQVNATYHQDDRGHSVPGFDLEWRQQIVDTWRAVTTAPIEDGGVYFQSTGPRFETPAEVRAIANFADVVGMTLAGECILAREAGIRYAAICTVDNLANGLGDALLTPEEFRAGVAANQARLRSDLGALIPALVDRAETRPR